jgi:hypothetical protein
MLLPALRFLFTYRAALWAHSVLAPGAVTALVLILYMIDNLSNALFQPVFVLMAGALASVTGAAVPLPARPPAPLQPPPPVKPTIRPPGVLSRPLPR